MDPDPPDCSTTPTPPPPPHSTMPDPPVPPRNPSPPRHTKDSKQTPIQPHMELVRSLEALQLSSCAARSSTHQDEEQVATPYNLLLKVANPQGTAREIPIHAARLELQTAWGDSYKAVSEHLFPVHTPNVPVQVQDGRDGTARLAAHDNPPRRLPQTSEQAPAPASRAPGAP
ncbi:unnamed protein product [Miscanthus lutarioriparius]|uniref:Uncharacterized protein n=1 Tax=Miscanthus lutarioriparius TaxID=422564 RepID=A0A811N142_9POAL|nr:unnamed protein product [Miscanthus lutarioriparius]